MHRLRLLLLAAMPNANVVAFDGVGNIPHTERPKPFLDAVVRFLDAP